MKETGAVRSARRRSTRRRRRRGRKRKIARGRGRKAPGREAETRSRGERKIDSRSPFGQDGRKKRKSYFLRRPMSVVAGARKIHSVC